MNDSAANAMGDWVFDTTDAGFEIDVIERSRHTPVVVDFWAPWCGPCRVLGPLLERLTKEAGGKLLLAKVNVDENPELAAAFGVQSIPMVLGLRDGRIVSEFVGALPESGVREFLARVLPSEADNLAAEAERLERGGSMEEAEGILRRALTLDPRSDRALLGLARLLARREAYAEALELLEKVALGTPERAEADRLAATIRVRQTGGADERELRARVAADPNDLEARFVLAQVLAASGDYEGALEHYLAIVKRGRTFRDDGARKAMLDIFELLGSSHETTERFRSELAKVLFS